MAFIGISALVWSSGGETGPRIASLLAAKGADVRRFAADGAEALVETCELAPLSFVVLDGAVDETRALCTRLRALPHGGLVTVVVVAGGDERASTALLQDGADAVWPRDVSDAVAASALERASARARASIAGDAEVMSSIIADAPGAVFVVSADGTIRSASAGVQAMLGRPPAELEGRALWALVEDADADLARALVAEAVGAGDLVAPAVVRARRHDGTVVELELAARSMLDDAAICGVLVAARDVSERMSVGAALQESEIRFAAIFDNLLDGLVQVEEESGRLVQANQAFCRMTGYDAEEVSRLTLLDLFPADEREAARALIDAHFCGARSVSEALSILHKDGTPLYVDLGTTRLELSGMRFVLAVVRDVTARRATERTRELFLGVVAHELRTPVAVLQHSVELLRSNRAPSSTDRDVVVGVIADEVQRLVRLVSDAVELGAIQAGTFVLASERVDLAPLVRSVVDRVAPQFDGRPRIRIDRVHAIVDPVRFEQVVTKLLDNAWRHGGDPDIEVSLVAVDGAARLDVVDRGPGLPSELRTNVFERVLVPNDGPTSGIGIGLWLAKRLVSSMGGTIDASSGPDGRGLRVTVIVPLAEDATRTA